MNANSGSAHVGQALRSGALTSNSADLIFMNGGSVPGFAPARDHPAAQRLGAVEVAANLRPALVDRAEAADRIQGDAGPVAPLLKAAHAVVLDDQLLGHGRVHPRGQLNEQVAAQAAAGTGGKVVEGESHW